MDFVRTIGAEFLDAHGAKIMASLPLTSTGIDKGGSPPPMAGQKKEGGISIRCPTCILVQPI